MQVVFQRTANQVFNGEVIHSFGRLFIIAGHCVVHFIHCKFPNRQRNGIQSLFFGNFAGSFADKIFDIMLNRKLQPCFFHFIADF